MGYLGFRVSGLGLRTQGSGFRVGRGGGGVLGGSCVFLTSFRGLITLLLSTHEPEVGFRVDCLGGGGGVAGLFFGFRVAWGLG